MPKRDRGRFLSDKGYNKVWQAIQTEFPNGYSLADLSALTAADANEKAGRSVSPDTISNIINRRAKADRSCIQSLFAALGLTVESEDVTSDPPMVLTRANDPNFVGRDGDLAHLDELVNQGAKCIFIWAPGGVGKTILAQKYLDERFSKRLDFQIGKETQNIDAVESLVEGNLRKLGEEPGREFAVSLLRLQQKLQSQAVGILIDNLEPALDQSGRFIEKHRNYVKLLSVLTDPTVKSVTLITSRERLEENLNIAFYKLRELSVEAWQEFWKYQKIDTDIETIAPIHRAYGGNALAMKVLCDPILRDFQGNVEEYWRECKTEEGLFVEMAVRNLIGEQFNRLETVCPEIYNLLCRMGCYRYQDVPTVPKEGLLCLLWDVPERQRQRVIIALRERALVEFESGEYKLHPIVREAAIERLRKREDWEEANRTAAAFWTESVETVETVEDALRAFEAFHHYIKIEKFDFAGEVLIKMRANKWEKSEPLGRAFYRLGLLQQMIISINSVIDQVNPGYSLSRLHNILGDLYWLAGNIKAAIASHRTSGALAEQSLDQNPGKLEVKFWLTRLKRYCLFNISLCKMDIWEIEEAVTLHKMIEKIWYKKIKNNDQKNIEYGFYENETIVGAWSCLAFLNSSLKLNQQASYFADKAYNCMQISNYMDSWCKGYAPLFLGLAYKNLEERKKSFEMYNRAILYAEDSHYPQVKAKALTGLSELHRIQKEFETALSHHIESIEILDKLGAKCDLAEAYYQQGLTYQAMGELERSNDDFNRAIQLWSEIGAPKQIARVRQSMNPSE